MSDVSLIGAYQLQNLQRHAVRFLYFDLSAARSEHGLLAGSEQISPDAVLGRLNDIKATPDVAIVLICENGEKSLALAQTLGENSFMNVFVVEGGVRSLP